MKPTAKTETLSSEELLSLRRHRNRTIAAFVLFQIYMVAAFGAVLWLDLPKPAEWLLMGILLAGVIATSILQFSKRCPRCGANLGWQVRLGVPPHCKKCGVQLVERKAVS